MGQACGKTSLKDGGSLHPQEVQQSVADVQVVQVVGSWRVPSAPPGRPPLSPDHQPGKKEKKNRKKKDKEKKGLRGTLDAWSSFGSFNGSFNEKQGREKRVGILGFEIANLVMKMMNLRMGLYDEELARFKEEVILSEASRKLISEEEGVLWTIAALDRRRELAQLIVDVSRLGKQSADPELQKLDKKLARLGFEGESRPKLSASEVDANIDWLQEQIAATADLYHELLAMDTVNASLRRTQAEEEQFPGTQKESLAVLKQEVKDQERLVRSLKKKGLWSKKLDHILEVLVELIHALHEQLIDAFYPEVPEETLREDPKTAGDPNELGVQGLALHYANIISSIDKMVSRPNSVSPASRDVLYQMLPQGIKATLRDEINKALEDDSIAGIRRNLDAILDVVTPVAGNTVRWCSDRRLQGHSDLCLMQTLHHADQTRMEALILELVVNLHHLMSRAKNPLNPSGKSPNRTPSRSPIRTPPRVFPAESPDADVAEALEAIPVHLRVVLEPSLVDRAERYLAKLDIIRTANLESGRTSGVRTVDEVNVLEANGADMLRDGEMSSAEVGAAVTSSGEARGVTADASLPRVTSDGVCQTHEKYEPQPDGFREEALGLHRPNQMPSTAGPVTVEVPDIAPAQNKDASLSPSDTIEKRPGWGLGLLKKSKSAKPIVYTPRARGSRDRENGGVREDREHYPESRPADEQEGPGLGMGKLQKSRSAAVIRNEPDDVRMLPRGWHPADPILEGATESEGLSSNHSGLREDESPRIGDGGFSKHQHVGLRGDGSPNFGVAGNDGLSSHHTGLGGDGRPGLRSEVSLNSGTVGMDGPHSDSIVDVKVRSCRISSELFQPTGLDPNKAGAGPSRELGPRHGVNRHSEGGLKHGFGSDLQIGEIAAEESGGAEDGILKLHALSMQRRGDQGGGAAAQPDGYRGDASSPKPDNQAGYAPAQVPFHAYHSDATKLTHRVSDPSPRTSAPSVPARSQSYSGPQEPLVGRKSRLSVEGSLQSQDARSYSENNLHGLVQQPSSKKHSGELRQSHELLKKHSGELKSPSSKRASHELLGSPKTPRRSSPNSRSFSRRQSSKSQSPRSSMSPRSLEPLSPAGVIDIDLIDI